MIFDSRNFYRLESDVYGPDKRYANFTIAGGNFTLGDGILGIALSPPQHPYGARSLYFRPVASLSVYAADTQSLKSNRYNGGAGVRYIQGNNVLTSQATTMAFSKEGTLFYGLTREIAIGCWNIHRPLQPQFFVSTTRNIL